MGKKNDRLSQIVQLLKERSGMTIKELSSIFHVSEMTIRRDLEVLKANHQVQGIYGAVLYNPGSAIDTYHITDAKDSMKPEKTSIGAYAASLIEENDVVMLDIGTTTEKVAQAISSHVNTTVICCSYNTLTYLQPKSNLTVFLTGGCYHPDTQLFESPESIAFLKNTRARKVFASAAGIHQRLGLTCANNYEAATKKALLQSCAERILLVDSQKFGQIHSNYFAKIEDYQKIITDQNLSNDWEAHLTGLGIEVIRVNTDYSLF